MTTGEPQITFPKELRLQKLHLKFAKPRSSDTDLKITLKGNNGRKVESEKRCRVEKGTTLERIECAIGGKPWTENIENFRIDDSATIQLRLTKAGSGFMTRNKRESAVVRWSHIKSANRTGDELVYETEDSSLKATVRLQFQASPAEVRLDSIEVGIQKAILSQDDREEITSKFKSINNTLKPILEALEKVSQIHPVAVVVVGLVKMAHDRLLDRQIKYDEVVRNFLQDMTNIHPFARVASMNQFNDVGLVHQAIAEMLNLIQDACEVITVPNHNGQRAYLKVLTAVSGDDLAREFKRKLDNVIRNFNMALNTEAHAKIMTVDQRAEAIEIKEWLTSLDVIKRFDSIISSHVPGTGSWFLEREDIRTWIEGESDAVRVFCKGIPGCGKTMMISLVCKALLQRYQKSHDTAVLRVYFDHKDPQTHSFENIILSVTRQLIQQSHATPEWIRNYYYDHKNLKDADILRIQLSAKLKSSYSKVFILADAMDECPPNVQRRFLDFVRILAVNTHVLITSRPGLGVPDDISLWTVIDLQAHSDDVLKYIERRLSDSDDPDMLKNQENLRTDIREKVLLHADGVMLLAKLHMDAITQQNTLAGLINVLEDLPKGLIATFEDTAQRIKKQKSNDAKLAVKILMWIVGAERPLSVRELQCAAALELTEPCFDERAQAASTTMTRVCAGLVIVDEGDVVRLVHLTVQEYFNGVKDVFFDEMQVQLATLCLHYLLSVSRQGLIYGGSALPWYEDDVPAFLYYCSSEWPRHSSGCQLRVSNLVLQVLQHDAAIEHSFNAVNRMNWWKIEGTALHLVAYHGLQHIMTVILQTGSSNPPQATAMTATKLAEAVGTPNSKGRTPLSYAAGYGHLDVVKALLARNEVALDEKDKKGRTPLSYAAGYGHTDVVNVLLKKDSIAIDDKDEHGRTPLSYAAEYGHPNVVKVLLAKDEVALDEKDKKGRSPLSYAARYGHLDVVNALRARGEVALDEKDRKGRTPFSYAVEHGNLDMVNALLIKDVVADSRDEEGRSPLSYAAECGHLDVVNSLLLKDEVESDSRDKEGRSPLSHAAEKGTLEVIDTLLRYQEVQADDKDNNCRTPLSHAASSGNIGPMVALLRRREVEPDGRDGEGRTPLSYAANDGHLEAIKLLLTQADVLLNGKDDTGRTPLSHAAGSLIEDLEVMRTFLAQDGIEADGKDNIGRTPLCYAAIRGNLVALQALLEQEGVKVDGKDDKGRTALSYAVESRLGSMSAISSLSALEGVDVNSRDNLGRTPLSYAAEREDPSWRVSALKAFKELAKHGVEVDGRDNTGRTPLSYAADGGNLAMVNALLARDDVDPDGIDDVGRSPLSYAVGYGRTGSKIVTSLLSRGVDVNREDNDGGTPLSRAAECEDGETVDVLLAHHGIKIDESTGGMLLFYAAKEGRLETVNALIAKVKVDVKDSKGRSALSHSAKRGHVEVVNALLAQKIKINDKDEKGRSALALAAEYGHLDVVITLLARDEIEVDGRDKEGRTPLSFSAEYGHLDVLNCLLEQEGVNGDSKDNNGLTPLSYAAKYGHRGCLKALLAREEVVADTKDNKGRTPLSHGAQNGHIDVIKDLLMQDEVDADRRDKDGRAPLSYAAEYGHMDVVKELLKRDGVKPDCVDTWRRIPLAYAAKYGHLGVVTTLLALDKVEPNTKDKWGKTPLILASQYGQLAVVRTLMAEDRIDVNAKDNEGLTPLMHAALSGHVPAVNTLICRQFTVAQGIVR